MDIYCNSEYWMYVKGVASVEYFFDRIEYKYDLVARFYFLALFLLLYGPMMGHILVSVIAR